MLKNRWLDRIRKDGTVLTSGSTFEGWSTNSCRAAHENEGKTHPSDMKQILLSIRNSVTMSFCHQDLIPHAYHNNMKVCDWFRHSHCFEMLERLVHSPPSSTASTARIRKGAVLPTNSYMTLPNGGPTTQHTHIYSISQDEWLRLQALHFKLRIFTLKTLTLPVCFESSDATNPLLIALQNKLHNQG